MTVAATTDSARNDYQGNNTQTVFSFTFQVLEESNQILNKDFSIKVLLTEDGVETEQMEDIDYTVQISDKELRTGTVTFTTAPTTTQQITFLSDISFFQDTDYINIGTGKFPADSHEGTVDKLTLIARQQQEAIDRSILLPESSNLTGVTIPVSVENADKAIVVNSTGDNLDAKNLLDISTIPVTAFAESLLDDENAEEARSTLELDQPWDVIANKLNIPSQTATIAAGSINLTGSHLKINGEGNTDDELNTISGGTNGDIVILRPNGNGIITVNDDSISGGNIILIFSSTRTLEFAVDSVTLQFDGSFWREISSNTDKDSITNASDSRAGISQYASKTEQEAGVLTNRIVTPGRQHNHPSAAKAWVVFNGTGTLSVEASYNVASVTDNGTGDYTINLNNAMSSANFAMTYANTRNAQTIVSKTASTVRVQSYDSSNTLADSAINAVVVYGDQ